MIILSVNEDLKILKTTWSTLQKTKILKTSGYESLKLKIVLISYFYSPFPIWCNHITDIFCQIHVILKIVSCFYLSKDRVEG